MLLSVAFSRFVCLMEQDKKKRDKENGGEADNADGKKNLK